MDEGRRRADRSRLHQRSYRAAEIAGLVKRIAKVVPGFEVAGLLIKQGTVNRRSAQMFPGSFQNVRAHSP